MKDIRLLLAVLFVAALGFGFTACGDDADPGDRYIPDSSLTGKWFRVRSVGSVKFRDYPEADSTWSQSFPISDTCDYNVFDEDHAVEMVAFPVIDSFAVKHVYNGTWSLSGQSLTIATQEKEYTSRITTLTKTVMWLDYSGTGLDEVLGPYQVVVSTSYDKYFPPKKN